MSLPFSDEVSLQASDSRPLTPPSSEPRIISSFPVDSQGNFIQEDLPCPDGAEPFSPNIDIFSLIDWTKDWGAKDEKGCLDPLSLDGNLHDNSLWLENAFSLVGNSDVIMSNNNNPSSMGATPMSDDTIVTTPLTSGMANINISDLPTIPPPPANFPVSLQSANIFSHTMYNTLQTAINSNPISNTSGIPQLNVFPSLPLHQQQPTAATTVYPEIPYDMAFMGCAAVSQFHQMTSVPPPTSITNNTPPLNTTTTTTDTTTTTTTPLSKSKTAKGKRARCPSQEANPAPNTTTTDNSSATTEDSRPKRKSKPTPPPAPKQSPYSEDNTAESLDENDPSKIEDMKRNRRLQKNRQAAQQFRARQKAHIQETEERVEQLKINNSESTALLEILEAENRLLKEQLNYLHNFISSAVSIQNIPTTGTTVSTASSSIDQITPNTNNNTGNTNNMSTHTNTNSDTKENEGEKMSMDSDVTPAIPTSIKAEH
eukprot:TRINITY_DN2949_c0_g1_i1.p1 TRINITY_DN2949_c0_g1~~TRINITY_DN2949_c0_g1_i1.p1  ORF type:complete len:484 (-),score=122.44 TRINITY_DN2949_c0_g1_i1:383-1834(-)